MLDLYSYSSCKRNTQHNDWHSDFISTLVILTQRELRRPSHSILFFRANFLCFPFGVLIRLVVEQLGCFKDSAFEADKSLLAALGMWKMRFGLSKMRNSHAARVRRPHLCGVIWRDNARPLRWLSVLVSSERTQTHRSKKIQFLSITVRQIPSASRGTFRRGS